MTLKCNEIKAKLLIMLLLAVPAFAQDIRPSAYIGQAGKITVRSSKVLAGIGGVVTIPQTDITPALGSVTYIYLDLTASPVIATNNTSFPASSYFPICIVTTNISGVITAFTDSRPDAFLAGAGGGGGGGGTWGGILGTLSDQSDIQTALNQKADDGSVVHDTGDETILGNKAFGGATSLLDTAIDGQLTTDGSLDFLSTWPSSACTASSTSTTRLCIDTDGSIKQSINGAAPSAIGGTTTTWPAGTTAAPGWPAINHPELGLTVVPSATTFSVTNVSRASNVAVVTIDTTPFTGSGHLLNWPTNATFKLSGIPPPYDSFNGDFTATAVGTNTVTFAQTAANVSSTPTTGNAQIYSLIVTGYEVGMTRFVSTSTNAAHWGSIRLGKTDGITRAGDADPVNTTHVLLQGESGSERALVGDSSGLSIPGPIKSTEQAAPAAQANAADYNLFVDSTSHKLTCKLGSGATDCMPAQTGGSALLNKQINTGAVTGTGAAANLVSFVVPGGTMTVGGCLRTTIIFQHTTGSASVAYSMAFGGSSTGTISSALSGSQGRIELLLCNGVTVSSQQYVFSPLIIGTTVISGPRGGFSINTANDQTLAFQFNVAATDAVTGYIFTIELLK